MIGAALSLLLLMVSGCHCATLLSPLRSHQSAMVEPRGALSDYIIVFPHVHSVTGQQPVPSRQTSDGEASPQGWVVPVVSQTRTLARRYGFWGRTASPSAGLSGSKGHSVSLKATQKNGAQSDWSIDNEFRLSDSAFPWLGGSPSRRLWSSDQYVVHVVLGDLKSFFKSAAPQQNDLSEQKVQSPRPIQTINLRSALRLRDSPENTEDVLINRSLRDWSRVANHVKESNDKTLFNDLVTPLVDTQLVNVLNPALSYGGDVYSTNPHSPMTDGHFSPGDIMWDIVNTQDKSPLNNKEGFRSALLQRINPKASSSEDDLSSVQTMEKRPEGSSINSWPRDSHQRYDSTLLSHFMRPFTMSKKRARINRGELARRLHQPGQLLSLVMLRPWSRRGRGRGRENKAVTQRRLLHLLGRARPPGRFDSIVTRRGGGKSLK